MNVHEQELAARVGLLRTVIASNHQPNTPGAVLRQACVAILPEVRGSSLAGADPRQVLRQVVEAERLVRLAEQLEVQGQLAGSELLSFAQTSARGSYRDALAAAAARGRPVEHQGRWPEPVVVLEPMASPMTFVRTDDAKRPGFSATGRARLPFPLVLLPPYPLAALGSLAVVHHEIGHNLDDDFGICEALEFPLEDALDAGAFGHDVTSVWSGWRKEVVADAIGVLLASLGLPIEQAAWTIAMGDEPQSRTHPPTDLRIALMRAVLADAGFDAAGRGLDVAMALPDTATPAPAELAAAVPTVVRTILETELPRLGGGTLRDFAPDVAAEGERLIRTGRALASDQKTAPDELLALPLRLLPSVARIATAEGAEPARVAKMLLEHARTRPSPEVAEFSIAKFQRNFLRVTQAPILDEEREGLKRPPPGLFARSQAITFVGASNDSLPELVAAARPHRLTNLDVFYLTDAAVRRLEHAGRSAEELASGRRQSLAALRDGRLDHVAERWRVFEYDDPYFFAAYYDAREPGGRIHSSSAGWDQDLKRAPAVDLVWPSGEATPTQRYRWYLAALDGLEARARLIDSSHFDDEDPRP